MLNLVPRNYDPKLHPFEVPREYQRALNAAKLDRIFAKPFLGALDGHADGVQCLMKHPSKLSYIVSGACDGEIRIWNIAQQRCVRSINAHSGIVRSLCAPQDGDYFFSVDNAANIKQWKYFNESQASDQDTEYDPDGPIQTFIGKNMIMNMDHHWTQPLFMTCGESVELWEETRAEPLKSLKWGVDTVYNIKFNPIETDLCASTASDRSIIFYDVRKSKPLRKVTLEMRSNTICWNPMEAFNFTAANEDYE